MQKTVNCYREAWWRHGNLTKTLLLKSLNLVIRQFIDRKFFTLAMKLTIVLLTAVLTNVYASGVSQTVSFSGVNVSLKEIFAAIKKQTGYVVFSDREDLENTKPVSLSVSNLPLIDFLGLVLKDQPLTSRIEANTIILSRRSERPRPTVGGSMSLPELEIHSNQLPPISGAVLGIDQKGLSLASISVRGTQVGTTSDELGRFKLGNLDEKAILVVTCVGYNTIEIPLSELTRETSPALASKGVSFTKSADGSIFLSIRMTLAISDFDEMIVVGYGEMKKRDVTGAIGSFNSKQFDQTPQTNIGQVLQGKIAGLAVDVRNSSAENGGTSMLIRGRSSITASSDPLVILDGIPYDGPLQEISPTDIASIEVLKDASSAAIYGARAANGVILIKTKKGSKGRATVKFDGFYAVDEIAREAEYFDAEDWYKYTLERYGPTGITADQQKNYDDGIFTDWQRLATRNGSRQQYTLSVAGGGDAVNYYVSANYNNTKGITAGDQVKRTNVRFNLTAKIADWITFGTNTQLGRFDRSGVPASYALSGVVGSFSPLDRAYNDDGSIRTFPMGVTTHPNLLDPLSYDNNDVTTSIFSNNYLLIKIPYITGLSYKVNTGYTTRSVLSENYQPRTSGRGFSVGGLSNVSNSRYENWLLDNILTYDNSFGRHNLNFTGLYSMQSTTEISHALIAQNFPNDIRSFYQASSAVSLTPSDSYLKRAYISQMGRLNYNFDGRYLLTATVRRDGYSGFGPNSKFGIFPSVAVGWNFSRESFLSKQNWLNEGKIRLSYGENGNQAIGAYATLPVLSSNYYLTTDDVTAIGYYPNKLGDPSLGWESSRSFNFGLDLSLFNVITGSIDIYKSRTHDLLLDRNISSINGTNTIRQNIGSVSNFGYEIQLSTRNISTRNFSWTTDFTLAFAKNKILNVGLFDDDGNPIDDMANNWFIGESIDIYYGYRFDHIMQEHETPPPSQTDAQPGWTLVYDLDGNGVLNSLDRQILGNSRPLYYAGLNNSLTYKNFTLSFFLNAQRGKINHGDNNFWNVGRNTRKKEFWSPETPDVVFPKNDNTTGYVGVTLFDKRNSTDFIRLQDITLSYKLPNRTWLRKARISQAEVFCNAKNLFLITNWAWGPDPEFSDQDTYPSLRTTMLGLRVSF